LRLGIDRTKELGNWPVNTDLTLFHLVVFLNDTERKLTVVKLKEFETDF